MDKNYCYIATHKISVDSNLNRLYVSDNLQNISVFDNEKYKLEVKTDESQKLDSLIYTSYYEKDLHKFTKEAKKVLTKAINRLKIAFGLAGISAGHSIKIQQDTEVQIECFDYESKITYPVIAAIFLECPTGSCSLSTSVKQQDIKNVLKNLLEIDKNNIDEHIGRFLSLANLNSDPVLDLISLYSLYEYIGKHDETFKSLFNVEITGKYKEKKGQLITINFLDKFKCTRDLVAHGLLDSPNTLYILKQFLNSGSNQFDRYNQAHIDLINRVIIDAQSIIKNYLRKGLGIKE